MKETPCIELLNLDPIGLKRRRYDHVGASANLSDGDVMGLD